MSGSEPKKKRSEAGKVKGCSDEVAEEHILDAFLKSTKEAERRILQAANRAALFGWIRTSV